MRLYEKQYSAVDNTSLELPAGETSRIFALTFPNEFAVAQVHIACETDVTPDVAFTARLYNRDVVNDAIAHSLDETQAAAYRAISAISPELTGTTAIPSISEFTSVIVSGERSTNEIGGTPLYLEIVLDSALEEDTFWAVKIAGLVGGALQ